jgi:hypothetical protein
MKRYYAIPHEFVADFNKTIVFSAKNMKDAVVKVEAMNLSHAVYIVPVAAASKNVVWAMGTQGDFQRMEYNYLKAGGGQCPKCKSGNIGGQSVDIDGNKATQEMVCLDCEHEWTDLYKLAGILEE